MQIKQLFKKPIDRPINVWLKLISLMNRRFGKN